MADYYKYSSSCNYIDKVMCFSQSLLLNVDLASVVRKVDSAYALGIVFFATS